MILTNREKEVINEISKNPEITQIELSKKLGISRSSVAVHIMNLNKKGFIKGRKYILGNESSVIVIGGSNVDIHGISDSKINFSDSNPGKIFVSPGGVARNIAENLCQMNISCKLISAVGNDSYGEMLINKNIEAGIDTRFVIKHERCPTSSYLSIIDDTGEMVGAISDMDIISTITPNYLESIKKVVMMAEVICLDTNLNEDSIEYIFNTFGNIPIFVDPVSAKKAKKILPFISKINTLKPNINEAEELSNIKIKNKKDLNRVSSWFHEKGLDQLFISLGSKGLFYSNKNESGSEEPKNKKNRVKNVSGAGDTVMASLIHSYKKGYKIRETARNALIAASISIGDQNSISRSLSADKIKREYNEQYAQ